VSPSSFTWSEIAPVYTGSVAPLSMRSGKIGKPKALFSSLCLCFRSATAAAAAAAAQVIMGLKDCGHTA
jgi:hypothetical protein